MMAAAVAAGQGHEVCLLEKNEKLGKKIYITGKGRCNVTNAADRETFFQNVCTNEKFLYGAFSRFNNQAVMEFLEAAGCSLKIERGGRVFPVSDHASDIIAAFARVLKKENVDIRLKQRAVQILTKSGRFAGVKLADGEKLMGDACIICTGGLSYPSTGSTGDGFRFAEETGHKVIKCRPSLVPLCAEEEWCKELMGLSLKNVAVSLRAGGKEKYSGFGEMLFTHFGVSGPLILSASSYYAEVPPDRAALLIDLKPALSAEQLDKRLLRDFDENRGRQFKNALGELFPAKLIPVMIKLSGIRPEKRVNEITKQERRAFAELMKSLPLTITGTRGFSEAVITKGGVSVKEVNPSTLESKKMKGLYFAGEVLDLDAMTGGFNLQIAWSTGHLAGMCEV